MELSNSRITLVYIETGFHFFFFLRVNRSFSFEDVKKLQKSILPDFYHIPEAPQPQSDLPCTISSGMFMPQGMTETLLQPINKFNSIVSLSHLLKFVIQNMYRFFNVLCWLWNIYEGAELISPHCLCILP